MKTYLSKLNIIFIICLCLSLSGCGGKKAEAITLYDEEILSYENSEIDNDDEETERITTPTGRSLSVDTDHANIPGVKHDDLEELCDVLDNLENLTYVNLGKDNGIDCLTPEDVLYLTTNYPDIKFDYTFDIFGVEVTLDDEVLDFNHVTMDDNGEKVISLLKVLRNPKSLDMDFTGVDNEVMAQLRQEYPDMDIQWRIWIGDHYSVRTDCERFIASEPTVEVLTGDELSDLKYCTKIRFLDIGHNEITDISFLNYMPDLEVAIICINSWEDLSPISNCTKLNYLEINDTNCKDLSPLEGCTSLEHLNICNLGDVTGWDSIKNLTNLERLWIGGLTNISSDELAELKESLPNTEINTTTFNSDLGDWRWTVYPERVPRYEQLFIEMGYYMSPSNQSYYYEDPKYYPEGYDGERVKWPEW